MNAAHKPVAKDVPIEGDERGSSGVFPVVARAADEDIPSCERPTVPVPRSAGDTVDDESVYNPDHARANPLDVTLDQAVVARLEPKWTESAKST